MYNFDSAINQKESQNNKLAQEKYQKKLKICNFQAIKYDQDIRIKQNV